MESNFDHQIEAMQSETDDAFSSVYETNDTSSFASEIPSDDQELDMGLMMERFAHLVLGGDCSGGGQGVPTSLAVSNAITNIYSLVFESGSKGLQPLDPECKAKWKSEMNFLLAPCDYMGEQDQVLSLVPRPDIYHNLPALRKLDAMLLGILDGYKETEFSYEVMWPKPVPCIPPGGLTDKSRRQLHKSRRIASQILKAARLINDSVVAEMEVPESYITSLPKSGKQAVGNYVYFYMAIKDSFSPIRLVHKLDLTSENEVRVRETLEKMEAAMYIWSRKASRKLVRSKSSWNVIKDSVSGINRAPVEYNVRAERARDVIFYLKQIHPQVTQTSLTVRKIEDNKDVGKATLESYSRVLESLARTVASLIDDVLMKDNTR